jgi:TP901 family phage tail tape measure protein
MAETSGAFVERTGRLDTASEMQDVFAEFKLATDAAGRDIGRTAADLFEKFDIKTIDEMRNALALLAVQGKKGAFEIQDAAQQFPRMAAAAKAFGIQSGAVGVGRLGALAQIARKGTGSGAMAATGIENVLREMTKGAKVKKLKKLGVDVFTDESRTQTRDIKDIVVEMIAGTKGDKTKLSDIFGMRASRSFSHLIGIFNKTFRATGDLEEATKAVRKEFNNLESAADAEAQIKKDAAIAQTMTSTSLTAAWEELKSEIGEELTPALISLAKKFSQVVTQTDAVEQLVNAFEALAEGAEGAAELLEWMGLLKPKSAFDKGTRETEQALRKVNKEELEFFGKGAKASERKKKIASYMQLEDMYRQASGGKLTREDRMRLQERMGMDKGFSESYADYEKGSGIMRRRADLRGRYETYQALQKAHTLATRKPEGDRGITPWDVIKHAGSPAGLAGVGAMVAGRAYGAADVGAREGMAGAAASHSLPGQDKTIMQSFLSMFGKETTVAGEALGTFTTSLEKASHSLSLVNFGESSRGGSVLDKAE